MPLEESRAAISSSGRARPAPRGRTVVGIDVIGVVLAHGQDELHVTFSGVVHRAASYYGLKTSILPLLVR